MGNSCGGASKDDSQMKVKKRKEKKTKKSKSKSGAYDEGSNAKGGTEQALIDFITAYASEEARDNWEELGEYKGKQNLNKGIGSATVTTDSTGRRFLGAWDGKAAEREGFGVYVDADGSIFEGFFKDGVRHGKGRHISSTGTVNVGKWVSNKFQGSYKVGQLDTRARKIDKIKNDNPTGTKMFEVQEGASSYLGATKDKKKHGMGIESFPNGDNYTGDYLDGVKQGLGVYTLANGDNFSGQFDGGIPNGVGVFTRKDGTVIRGQFTNGVLVNEF